MQATDRSKPNPKAAIAAKRGDQFRASLSVTSELFEKLRSPRRSRGRSSPILGRAVGTPFSSGASKVCERLGRWHQPSAQCSSGDLTRPYPPRVGRAGAISNPAPGSTAAERSGSPAASDLRVNVKWSSNTRRRGFRYRACRASWRSIHFPQKLGGGSKNQPAKL